jgi:hypothetical protein
MPESFESPWDDYRKWRKWAYEQWYGKGSWNNEQENSQEAQKARLP